MSSTLLQNATGLLTPELVSRVSSILGETEGATSKGLSRGAIPLLLAGLANKSQEVGSADKILALLRDPAYDPRAIQNAGSLLGEGGGVAGLRQLGERLISLLFGGRTDGLANALGEFAGIRSASASSLLRLAAPMVLGLLGDRVKRDNLDAPGLARLFYNERDDLVAALPGPLRSAAGFGRDVDLPTPPRTGAPRWLFLGLALLAVAVLWTLLRDRGVQRTADVRQAAELPPVAAAPPSIVWTTRRLPNGSELRIPDNGIEARLITRLEGGGSREEWIDFDRLLFETDSANLRPESQEQLQRVASILAAYPSAQVKIGGYTDDRGDPAANLDLSRNRAENVKASLERLGVDSGRLEAEGYGEQHPVASNATEEGRARNRRISLRIEES
jgi:outer membrane protein OmpA-like peptidoglycan-associated protein